MAPAPVFHRLHTPHFSTDLMRHNDYYGIRKSTSAA